MRVLMTGGTGCIGSWIARDLITQGHTLCIYDLNPDTRRLEQVLDAEQLDLVTMIKGDVTDQASLQQALQDGEISHVVHLAGLQVPTCRADPLLGARVNVLGTLSVFEAVRDLGDQVQRVVYASSAAVFGPPEAYEKGSLPDEIRLVPSTHYGAFKVCNESNARVYSQEHGIVSIGLRPFTVYGVGRDLGMTSAPTKAIKAVAIGQRYHINYGGEQDLQFVEDVAVTFRRCLEAPYEGAGAYNLRGTIVDLPEFCRALADVAPESTELITHGDTQLPIAYDLDDSGLRRDVGGIPRTELRDGIRQTFDHFKRLRDAGRLDTSDLED